MILFQSKKQHIKSSTKLKKNDSSNNFGHCQIKSF